MITLKTLADATPQQVFDQIATHLIKQNSRCSLAKSDDLCRYREGDLKCAAGCLISNDEYSQDMETRTWSYLIDKGMVPINSHTSLISRLQQMHDDLDVEDWGSVLKEIAYQFELNTDVLN